MHDSTRKRNRMNIDHYLLLTGIIITLIASIAVMRLCFSKYEKNHFEEMRQIIEQRTYEEEAYAKQIMRGQDILKEQDTNLSYDN